MYFEESKYNSQNLQKTNAFLLNRSINFLYCVVYNFICHKNTFIEAWLQNEKVYDMSTVSNSDQESFQQEKILPC